MKEIVYHSGCPDGIIARNILETVFDYEGYTLIPYNYEPNFGHLENAIWVDCSPATWEEFKQGLDNGCTYLDHHETRKPLFVQANHERAIYGENSDIMSGAMLAYKHYFEPKYNSKNMKDIAELAAISDTWQSDHPDFQLARGMAEFISNIGNGYHWYSESERDLLLQYAEVYKEKAQKRAKMLASGAIKITYPDGFKLALVNDINISNAAELLRQEGCNLIIGWSMFVNKNGNLVISMSLRSDTTFDSQDFAKQHGGGGHKQAAGISGYEITTFEGIQPLEIMANLLATYRAKSA